MSREIESFDDAYSEFKKLKETYSKIKIQIYSIYRFKKDYAEFERYFYDSEEANKFIKDNKYTFIIKEFLDATGERTLGTI